MRYVPINWSLLRERTGKCQTCGLELLFKKWAQPAYPYPAVECPRCFIELDMAGAVKDYFKESKD